MNRLACVLGALVFLAAATHAQAQTLGRYELTPPALPALEADVLEQEAQPAIVPQDRYEVRGADYLVQPLSGFLPRDVWLEKKQRWVGPVYAGSQAVGSQEIRLFELTGSVEIQAPEDAKAQKELTPGQLVPNGTRVFADSNSAAGVLIGNTVSLRLGPQTEVIVRSELAGSQRTTRLELKRGILFCRTLPGLESHDIQVQTPLGAAMAREGDFVVCAQDKRMTLWTVEGEVELATATNLVNTASPQEGRAAMVHLPAPEDPVERHKATGEALAVLLPLIDDLNRQTKAAVRQTAGTEAVWESETGSGTGATRSIRAFLPAHKTAEFGNGSDSEGS